MASDGIQFLYAGIRVKNVDRSIRFYEGLGFRVHARGFMDHGGEWIQLRRPRDRHRLELNFYPNGNRFYEPFRRGTEFDHFGFRAKDPSAVAKRLRALRAPIVADFIDEGSRLIYAKDPDGNWIEFFGPATTRRRRRGSA